MIVEETEFETSISFYKYTLQNLTYKVKEEFLFQIIFKYRKKKRDKISKINYLRCAREYQFNPSGSFPETNSTPGQILKKNLSLQRTRPTEAEPIPKCFPRFTRYIKFTTTIQFNERNPDESARPRRWTTHPLNEATFQHKG